MGIVIPLFVDDAFTGLTKPNRPVPEQFVVIDLVDGAAHCIYGQRWQAVNWVSTQAQPHRYAIEKWPAIKPTIQE
jgi:hypothetical protein